MSQPCNHGKEMNKIAWCTCKFVVLSIKTYYYFAVLLPSPLSLVLLSSKNSTTMATCRHTSPLYYHSDHPCQHTASGTSLYFCPSRYFSSEGKPVSTPNWGSAQTSVTMLNFCLVFPKAGFPSNVQSAIASSPRSASDGWRYGGNSTYWMIQE